MMLLGGNQWMNRMETVGRGKYILGGAVQNLSWVVGGLDEYREEGKGGGDVAPI